MKLLSLNHIQLSPLRGDEMVVARCEEAVRAVARVFDGGSFIDEQMVDELVSATNDLINGIRRSE